MLAVAITAAVAVAVAVAAAVAVAGMAGCLKSSLLRRICRRWPSSSVDCRISSPLRLIAASLLPRDPSRFLDTPSPLSVAVTPPGHRNCVVCGWHFESLLSRFSTRPILHFRRSAWRSPPNQPRRVHQRSVADAVAAGIEDQHNLCWPDGSAASPISSIPTSSVVATDLFHLEVHPLPSI